MLFNIAAVIIEDIFVVMHTLVCSCCYTRVVSRGEPDGLHDQMVPAGPVAHVHIKRRGGCALFSVAVDMEAMVSRAVVEQLVYRRGIAVEIDDHGAVRGKQRLEHLVVQAMRMLRILFQDQQICNVDHAHAQFGHF